MLPMRINIRNTEEMNTYDSAYSALTIASDHNVYFGLCTHVPGNSAGFFRLNTKSYKITKIFKIDEYVDNIGTHRKIHTPIIEFDKKLYFATHFAYPFGMPQDMLFEGGRLFSFDLVNEKVEELGIVSKGEGVITSACDFKNGLLYLLTIPSAKLIQYNFKTGRFKKIIHVPANDSVCRSMFCDNVGNLWVSSDNGEVIEINPIVKTSISHKLFRNSVNHEWSSASRGGVNKISRKMWRSCVYDAYRDEVFGIHSSGSVLFNFNTHTKKVNLLQAADKPPLKLKFPTLSLSQNDKYVTYVSSNGLFDYCRSENLQGFSELILLDKDSLRIKSLGEIQDAQHNKVFGAMASVSSTEKVYILGATQRNTNTLNPLNVINFQPFNISLVECEINV